MAEPDGRRKGSRKRVENSTDLPSPGSSSGSGSGMISGVPCGACKFLRRKCVNGCIFAPHFNSDQGTALFAGVHKVFGASNVSKLLMQLPVHHRQHAVETILYEAQARLSDPVYGCVSVIIGLQQQIASLQMQLAMVQNKLMYSTGASSYYNMNTCDPSLHNPANDQQTAFQSQLIFDPLQLSQPFCNSKDDNNDESEAL